MVRFTVLASGSKGNSTVVSGGRTRILVDAGLSCRELFRRMKQAGEDPGTLDAIVVTHEHQDHINGLAVTARKLGIPVYFTEATHRAWMRWLTPRRQMTYAQWLAACRRQAAERQAESEAGAEEGEAEEPEAEMQAVAGVTRNRLRMRTPPSRLRLRTIPPGCPRWNTLRPAEPFEIGDIAISPFTIPHDAADPVGFVFQVRECGWPLLPTWATLRPTSRPSSRASTCCCSNRTTIWRCCATALTPGR